MASFKWPPGNRRYAREQADSDRHLEKHHQRSGFNCRRFPLKQIRGRADDYDFRLVDSPGTNFFIRRFNDLIRRWTNPPWRTFQRILGTPKPLDAPEPLCEGWLATAARGDSPRSSSAQCRCPLLRRGSTTSSPKTAEVLTRIWSEQAALAGGADAGSSTSQPEETDQPTYPWSRS